jgi:hypothetical protein
MTVQSCCRHRTQSWWTEFVVGNTGRGEVVVVVAVAWWWPITGVKEGKEGAIAASCSCGDRDRTLKQ